MQVSLDCRIIMFSFQGDFMPSAATSKSEVKVLRYRLWAPERYYAKHFIFQCWRCRLIFSFEIQL